MPPSLVACYYQCWGNKERYAFHQHSYWSFSEGSPRSSTHVGPEKQVHLVLLLGVFSEDACLARMVVAATLWLAVAWQPWQHPSLIKMVLMVF